MPPRFLCRAVALIVASVPALLFASGTRTGFKDPDAIAAGNAFAATADNPSAIYYNPAGLTQIQGEDLSASVYAIDLDTGFSGQGTTSKMKDNIHPLPQVYFAWADPASKYAFGVGSYIPFGLSTNWSPDSKFSTLATETSETDYAVAAMGAYKITPDLSIGGGPVFHRISASLSRAILPTPGTDFTFTGDDTAVSFNVGLRWQPSPEHSFGLTYQSSYSSNLEGAVSFSPSPPFPAGFIPATSNFVFPEVIVGGYSYRPAPDWNLEADVEWMNWDRVNSIVIQNAPLPPESILLNWNSSYFFDFGVTHQFTNGLHASIGYTYAQNSVPNSTFNPAVPDANRQFIGCGVGGHLGKFDAQLTLQYGWAADRTVTGSPVDLAGQSADGTYFNRTYAIAFSLSRHF